MLLEDQFECTFEREHILERVPAPVDCASGKDYVVRTSCRGGSDYFWTMDGDSYEMQWNPGGPGYLLAQGRVGHLCHVEAPTAVGTVRAGYRFDSECTGECTICGARDPEPGCAQLPACDCPRAPDADYAVLVSLEELCAERPCPMTLDEALDRVRLRCEQVITRVYMGCGLITVDDSSFSGGAAYTFDATSGVLVGVTSRSDTPIGACYVNEYRGGTVRGTGACEDSAICFPCEDPPQPGGGGGEGGAPSANACPAF